MRTKHVDWPVYLRDPKVKPHAAAILYQHYGMPEDGLPEGGGYVPPEEPINPLRRVNLEYEPCIDPRELDLSIPRPPSPKPPAPPKQDLMSRVLNSTERPTKNPYLPVADPNLVLKHPRSPPSRPRSAYHIFWAASTSQEKAVRSIQSSNVGKLWNAMTPAQREGWEHLADLEKSIFYRDYPERKRRMSIRDPHSAY